MTKSELVSRIYKKLANKNLSTFKACREVVDEIENEIVEGLVEDKEVILGIFKLQQKDIKGRKGIMGFNGKEFVSQDKVGVKIKPYKRLKEELNK